MMQKKITVFIICVILFSSVFSFTPNSFAQSNDDIGTLDVGQDAYEVSYSEKTIVVISGNIKYPLGTKMVTLSIVNPDNEPD